MKLRNYVRILAIFMSVLIISLPFIFAEEYSRIYDKNGNLVYDSQTDIYREYNELNQLSRTRQNNISGTILQEYVWNPTEESIFIKDEFYNNGSLKSSTYYFGQDYIVLQNSSGTYNRTNIYQDGILVGYEDFDGKKRYVLPDHKGSAHLILNESGDVIEENLFSPFAEPLAGVKENKFSYEAKEFDNTVQDYDFHFRKYQPGVGFTQADTLIPNVYDPQSLNRYAFERNNPYKFTDPTGHRDESQYLTIPQAIATAGGGFSLSFQYFGLSFHAASNRQYKEAFKTAGTGLGTFGEAISNTMSVLAVGLADESQNIDLKSISSSVIPDYKKDLERIKEYYDKKEEEFKMKQGEIEDLIKKSKIKKDIPIVDNFNKKIPEIEKKKNNENSGGSSGGGGSSWCEYPCTYGPGVPAWENKYGNKKI